ncbi:hypothetical protein DSM112329_05358 [Paraconexibacter sp. AEG42_29]|uniref:DUF3592 domain-containing protein n=1 Tax=Paraconexibacter sp. AEG42_29 TaxID=2997339 RepID=A0AAU7B361_9ACTN
MGIEDQFGRILLGCGGVMLAAAVVILFVASRIRRSRRGFEAIAARGRGRITDVKWEARYRHGPEVSMRARVRLAYTLADGRPADAWSFESSSPAAGKVGAEVDVLYDPAAPDRVRVAVDRKALRLVSGFIVVFAAGFALFGTALAVAGVLLLNA